MQDANEKRIISSLDLVVETSQGALLNSVDYYEKIRIFV